MNSRPDCNNGRGKRAPAFTLVEVLIVIVIGAILAILTIPVAIRFYQSQLVNDTALTLKQTLRRAQANAVAARNDSPFGVRIQSNELVLFQGMNYASRVTSEDEHIDVPSTVTVTSTYSEFVFSKVYATSSASGTIAITGPFGGATANLSVASSGKIDLQ